jgi:DNA-binding transcriptional LysR family regulator
LPELKHVMIKETNRRQAGRGTGSGLTTSEDSASGLYWTELRIFLEVARARSFNRAAQSLGVSQPTVGRAVRRLEEKLGTQLIAEAFARGVKLTPPGAHLAHELVRFDRQLSTLLDRVSRL